ncbi:MAG: SIMPL domain-containing protein, partial [Limisphaerales bacterium]
SQFSQTPKYGLFGDKAKSYVVENTVKVTVHNEKEFQAVAGVVDSVNEARYLGVEFEQTDKVTYKNKALAEACDKASEKKQLLESKFGFKLVAQKMSEGVKVTPVGTQLAQYAEYGSSSRSSKAVGVTSISGSTSDGGDEGGANFGELIYTGEVTVEYRVEYRVEK